jgi:hypothetical protein
MKHNFNPDYISLSPTYRCGLKCAHCPVPQWKAPELPPANTVKFLQECKRRGIRQLGITGGEPFLAKNFLVPVLTSAAELGFSFDKIMTSAAWATNAGAVRERLLPLLQAGYDGKFCLSVDVYHRVATSRLVAFIAEAAALTGRGDICSLAYTSLSPTTGLEPIRAVAKALGLRLTGSLRQGSAHLLSPYLCLRLIYNHLSPVDKAEKLASGWDGKWFREDWCAGPGQALFVNPKGEVKPCCGFANDLETMTIGNISEHSVRELIARGRTHPLVGTIFRDGLTAVREKILRKNPQALPGKTSDHCFFCWYVQVNRLWPPTGASTFLMCFLPYFLLVTS